MEYQQQQQYGGVMSVDGTVHYPQQPMSALIAQTYQPQMVVYGQEYQPKVVDLFGILPNDMQEILKIFLKLDHWIHHCGEDCNSPTESLFKRVRNLSKRTSDDKKIGLFGSILPAPEGGCQYCLNPNYEEFVFSPLDASHGESMEQLCLGLDDLGTITIANFIKPMYCFTLYLLMFRLDALVGISLKISNKEYPVVWAMIKHLFSIYNPKDATIYDEIGKSDKFGRKLTPQSTRICALYAIWTGVFPPFTYDRTQAWKHYLFPIMKMYLGVIDETAFVNIANSHEKISERYKGGIITNFAGKPLFEIDYTPDPTNELQFRTLINYYLKLSEDDKAEFFKSEMYVKYKEAANMEMTSVRTKKIQHNGIDFEDIASETSSIASDNGKENKSTGQRSRRDSLSAGSGLKNFGDDEQRPQRNRRNSFTGRDEWRTGRRERSQSVSGEKVDDSSDNDSETQEFSRGRDRRRNFNDGYQRDNSRNRQQYYDGGRRGGYRPRSNSRNRRDFRDNRAWEQPKGEEIADWGAPTTEGDWGSDQNRDEPAFRGRRGRNNSFRGNRRGNWRPRSNSGGPNNRDRRDDSQNRDFNQNRGEFRDNRGKRGRRNSHFNDNGPNYGRRNKNNQQNEGNGSVKYNVANDVYRKEAEERETIQKLAALVFEEHPRNDDEGDDEYQERMLAITKQAFNLFMETKEKEKEIISSSESEESEAKTVEPPVEEVKHTKRSHRPRDRNKKHGKGPREEEKKDESASADDLEATEQEQTAE